MRRLLAAAALSALALSAQTKKVVVLGQTPDVIQDWGTATPKARVVAATPQTVMSELRDADAFIGEITPDQVKAAPNLRWVQLASAGVERVLHLSADGGKALRESPAVLTNNQIVQGPEIADHALAMLLTMSRGINKFLLDKATDTWQPRPYEGIELRGRHAVVIGLGGIGQQIAQRAWAFGMTVTGIDPEDIPFSPFWQKVVKPDMINDVLPAADVVFISAPHTSKSHKMVGPKQFELMKQGAYFIAVSRGGIYDMPSLVKALDSNKLSGAGVDVTDPEPLPPGHPLWKFKNTIVTPHIAGRSDKDRARMLGTIKENIRRFAEGMPLINQVDKDKGY